MSGSLPPSSPAAPLLALKAAVQERLRLAFPATAFSHGVVPYRLTPAAWERLTARTPFVGLGFGGLRATTAGGDARAFSGDARWSVFLVARNPVADALLAGAASGAGAATPGLLRMAGAALAALHGVTFAGLGTARVDGVQNMAGDNWGGEDTGVLLLDLAVPVVLDDDDAGAVLDDFLALAVEWASHPPAADVVTLEH